MTLGLSIAPPGQTTLAQVQAVYDAWVASGREVTGQGFDCRFT